MHSTTCSHRYMLQKWWLIGPPLFSTRHDCDTRHSLMTLARSSTSVHVNKSSFTTLSSAFAVTSHERMNVTALVTSLFICLGGKPTLQEMSKLLPRYACHHQDQSSRRSQSESLESWATSKLPQIGWNILCDALEMLVILEALLAEWLGAVMIGKWNHPQKPGGGNHQEIQAEIAIDARGWDCSHCNKFSVRQVSVCWEPSRTFPMLLSEKLLILVLMPWGSHNSWDQR
jgi:hypothetical protein